LGNSNFSGRASVLEGGTAGEIEVVLIVIGVVVDTLVAGAAVCVPSSGAFVEPVEPEGVTPTTHDCSGVKLGGEQGVLLAKPSLLRVMHELPAPLPLLIESRTRVKPVVVVPFRLKKNC
jgi:hypothetical protein